ncbi:MAG: DNA-binding protein [Prevotellaceae bacterium]|jgi:predicted histone-like DNA-binding protein|nr:DNA-binding protein [Prevotella sp.]MDO4980060.1 DNA-binding protein [Prevotellaceae bacterium]
MAKIGTLKYRLYQDNRDTSTHKGMWYARAVQDRELDFDGFVQHMADHNTTFSRGTIHGVLMDMLDCLQELILDGKSVRLGELGLFSLGLRTKPSPSAKEFSAGQNVKSVHLLVRNTKTWSNAELRKKCSISELEKNAIAEESVSPNP